MSQIAIRAEHLGKRYRIGAIRRHETARDQISAWVRTAGQRLRGRGSDADVERTLWALDDVSFEIAAGETVGIIGRNGAGKSTLLKVLSRITDPTTGFAEVAGRMGSLLEVGTGFHADLTGRENTYLNGAILGMRKAEIARKFDEIVAFSEIGRFIDTPVKHYSSGMYMRLAFAVAAHLETEILLIDEVLAVGDAAFQRKCLGKMDDVARQGRTVLFISHNMEAVQRLCSRGILLDHGRVVDSGPIAQVVSGYRAFERRIVDIGRFNPRGRGGTGWARISSMALLDDAELPVPRRCPEQSLTFELQIDLADPERTTASLRGLVVELVICSDQGQPLVSLMNVDDGGAELPAATSCRVRARLDGPTFIPGRYRVNAFLGIPYLEHVDEVPDAFEFELTPPEHPWRPYELHLSRGIMCRKAAWECRAGQPEIA